MASRSLFAIALSQESAPAWQALRERWPEQRCIASDRLAFVALGELATESHIKEALGFGVQHAGPAGVISQMHSGEYIGVLPQEAVAWLRKVERAVS